MGKTASSPTVSSGTCPSGLTAKVSGGGGKATSTSSTANAHSRMHTRAMRENGEPAV